MSFDKSLVDKIPKKYNGFVKTAIVIYVHERDFLLLTVTNREPAFDAGYKIKIQYVWGVGCRIGVKYLQDFEHHTVKASSSLVLLRSRPFCLLEYGSLLTPLLLGGNVCKCMDSDWSIVLLVGGL